MSNDVLEQGGRRFPSLNWRPSRGAAILGTAGLLAGLAAGYAAGDRQAGTSGRPPQRSAAAASASPAAALPAALALTQSTGACSAQVGRQLQLGIQVTNRSAADVTLRQVKAVLPLGGLKAVSQQWAPCGAIPAGPGQPGNGLLPGASTWLTVTFKVLGACPGPLPVEFTVAYDSNGQPSVASLPGFSDLSEVQYSGCPAN